MEILGHSQISLTLNTYSHVIPSLQRDAARRFDFPLQRDTITNMIDLALFDEQSRLVQLADVIPGAAATALLPFRGVW